VTLDYCAFFNNSVRPHTPPACAAARTNAPASERSRSSRAAKTPTRPASASSRSGDKRHRGSRISPRPQTGISITNNFADAVRLQELTELRDCSHGRKRRRRSPHRVHNDNLVSRCATARVNESDPIEKNMTKLRRARGDWRWNVLLLHFSKKTAQSPQRKDGR